MAFTLGTSEAIIIKAGVNRPSGLSSSCAIMLRLANMAEGVIMAKTNYDWVTNYSSIETNFKPCLEDAFSNYAGMQLISSQLSNYPVGEALTIVNILLNNFEKNILDLKDRNIQALGGA